MGALLGTLVRDQESGSLVLPAGAPRMDLWVLLRLYPRGGGCDVALVALHTLAAAARQLTVERSGVSVHVRLFISDAFPEVQMARWVSRAVSMFGDAAEVSSQRCAAGNVPSYDSVMTFVRDQAAAGVMVNTSVLYMLEDDYVHAASELVEVMSLFASHDPPFIIPYDYPDRYTRSDNRDAGSVSVVAGQHRHWRTAESMTVTFAARLHTVLTHRGSLPHPLSDRARSYALIDRGAYILAPLPSLAAHMERLTGDIEPYVSLYFDWRAFARDAINAAAAKGHALAPDECSPPAAAQRTRVAERVHERVNKREDVRS